MKPRKFRRLAVLTSLALAYPVLISPRSSAARAQTGAQDTKAVRQNMPPDFMGVAGIPGWVLSGKPRAFTKESLYGYIDGGAEIVLQYGFRDLTVF